MYCCNVLTDVSQQQNCILIY